MDILTFFALPIATIILAFVLEKVLRSPILTALTFFAIYLIVAFTAFDASFLVFAIVYTVLAYIAALIGEFIYTNCRIGRMRCRCGCNNNTNDNDDNSSNGENANLSDNDIRRIACRVANILSNNNFNGRRIR